MNNMMRKNNNRGGNNKHRSGGGNGGRRYSNNNGGGGNRGGANDGQNLQRQKHHATQQLGKYNDMARNAQINGDRVDVEYYLQHVDHYTRVLTDIAAIEAERHSHQRESQIVPGGPNDPNAQQHNQEAQGNQESSENSDQGSNGSDGNTEQSGDYSAGQNQPRMSRQPRRHHNEPSDNGAREANSNTTEIPLPGNILPPI
ncbi:MAG: DUF4167 domain-containing protein [Rickettsiales bacterium]